MRTRTKNAEPDITTPEGFKKAYDLYAGKMYSICRSRIDNPENAKEIVHDIFLSIWERKETLVIEDSIEKYLVRATKLKIIDFYRLSHRKETVTISSETEQHTDLNTDTEQQVNFQELTRLLQELMQCLPIQSRKIFQMSREQGLTNKEIASTLFISEKSVEYHMKKVLNFMKKHLA